MNSYNAFNKTDVRENVLAGLVGAFLFSLAGGLLWFGLDRIGIISSFSGLVGVICAAKGYALFAKKESVRGVIFSSLISAAVLVLAWYVCFGLDIYEAYQTGYEAGEVEYAPTFFESIQAVPVFLSDSEIGPSYIGDLAIGLLFALIGAVSYVVNTIKNLKHQAEAEAIEANTSIPEQSDNDSQL